MDPDTLATLHECTRASDEERLTFPEVVGRLMGAGVERYHADLLRSEKTYYLPDGESEVIANRSGHGVPADAFSPEGVEAAIRDIQAGRIAYNAFCDRVVAAGCVGYLVSMTGRRAVYYGRSGETWVEPFPGP